MERVSFWETPLDARPALRRAGKSYVSMPSAADTEAIHADQEHREAIEALCAATWPPAQSILPVVAARGDSGTSSSLKGCTSA